MSSRALSGIFRSFAADAPLRRATPIAMKKLRPVGFEPTTKGL
jgi:hypothetical protein